jgi:hypothetical protein
MHCGSGRSLRNISQTFTFDRLTMELLNRSTYSVSLSSMLERARPLANRVGSLVYKRDRMHTGTLDRMPSRIYHVHLLGQDSPVLDAFPIALEFLITA